MSSSCLLLLMCIVMSTAAVSSTSDNAVDSILSELSVVFGTAKLSGDASSIDACSVKLQSLVDRASSDKHSALYDIISLARSHIETFRPILPPTPASIAILMSRIESFPTSQVLADVDINISRMLAHKDASLQVKRDCEKLKKLIENEKAMVTVKKASLSLFSLDAKLAAAAEAINIVSLAEAVLGNLIVWHSHLIRLDRIDSRLAKIEEMLKLKGINILVAQRKRLGIICNSYDAPIDLEEYQRLMPDFSLLVEMLSMVYLHDEQGRLVSYWSQTIGFGLLEFQLASPEEYVAKFDDLVRQTRLLLIEESRRMFPRDDSLFQEPIVTVDTFLSRL